MCTSVFVHFICPIFAVCYNNTIYKNALRIKNPLKKKHIKHCTSSPNLIEIQFFVHLKYLCIQSNGACIYRKKKHKQYEIHNVF